MGEDFRLKWNDHHSIFFSTAEQLCEGDHLTDVTLSCGSREFSAHKLVLSICSTYFSQLFAARPENSKRRRPADSAAIVYLKDVDPKHMELLLNYMYRGEINVEESELMGLLATARGLQVKGLTESESEEASNTSRPTSTGASSGGGGGPNSTGGSHRTSSNNTSALKRPHPAARGNSQLAASSIKKVKEEVAEAVTTDDEFPSQPSAVTDFLEGGDGDDTSEMVDPDGYNLEESQGESMLYEGDPDNPGMELTSYAHLKASDKKCQFCEKSFTTRWKLIRHERSHTGERPYPCPICGDGSITKDALKLHCQSKHKMPADVYYKEVFPQL